MPAILVVDDSPVDRRLVGGLLERASGFSVQYASSGVEAMRKIAETRPHLVLTDLIMPGMDGLELVAAVVQTHPLTPVVLVTGKGSELIAVKALEAGASSYVPKGLLGQLLIETVEKVLAVASEKRTHAKLIDCMVRSECTFVLHNEIALIAPLVNQLNEWMCNLRLCDEATGIRLSVALEEALNNALYHGNLEISSSHREAGLPSYRKLIEERLASPPYCERQIHVLAKVSRATASFVIRDEGPGFDPSLLPDPTEPQNLERASGRGLLLMKTFMDQVAFNEAGNEVTMVKHATTTQPDASD